MLGEEYDKQVQLYVLDLCSNAWYSYHFFNHYCCGSSYCTGYIHCSYGHTHTTKLMALPLGRS